MGAVTVVVERVRVLVRKIPAAHVVDESVAIVVHPIRPAAGARLSWIEPDVRGQIGVAVVDTRVDHGDDDSGIAGCHTPGLGRIDVRVRCAWDSVHRLAEVLEPPQLVKGRIVRGARVSIRPEEEIRLRVANASVTSQGLDCVRALTGGHRGEHGIEVPEPFLRDRADPGQRPRAVARRNAALERDDELPGNGTRRHADGLERAHCFGMHLRRASDGG